MPISIPVLVYHRIENSGLPTATSPAVFREHLGVLRDEGWRSLSVHEFAVITKRRKAAPKKSFLMTFDGGYESIASIAAGILKEFRFKAICFLPTGLLRMTMHDGMPLSADRTHMTWDQARELQSEGIIDCQSYSHMPRSFAQCHTAEIEYDLAASVDMLSSELALPRKRFTHFAWPWGYSKSAWGQAAQRCGFKYQYTVARQSFLPRSPLDDIPRTCFDAASLDAFQRQLWLQSGNLAPVWNIAYPVGRKLRQLTNVLR